LGVCSIEEFVPGAKLLDAGDDVVKQLGKLVAECHAGKYFLRDLQGVVEDAGSSKQYTLTCARIVASGDPAPPENDGPHWLSFEHFAGGSSNDDYRNALLNFRAAVRFPTPECEVAKIAVLFDDAVFFNANCRNNDTCAFCGDEGHTLGLESLKLWDDCGRNIGCPRFARVFLAARDATANLKNAGHVHVEARELAMLTLKLAECVPVRTPLYTDSPFGYRDYAAPGIDAVCGSCAKQASEKTCQLVQLNGSGAFHTTAAAARVVWGHLFHDRTRGDFVFARGTYYETEAQFKNAVAAAAGALALLGYCEESKLVVTNGNLCTLLEYMQDARREVGDRQMHFSYGLEERLEICRQLRRVFSSASHIDHRDIRPENFWITTQPSDPIVLRHRVTLGLQRSASSAPDAWVHPECTPGAVTRTRMWGVYSLVLVVGQLIASHADTEMDLQQPMLRSSDKWHNYVVDAAQVQSGSRGGRLLCELVQKYNFACDVGPSHADDEERMTLDMMGGVMYFLGGVSFLLCPRRLEQLVVYGQGTRWYSSQPAEECLPSPMPAKHREVKATNKRCRDESDDFAALESQVGSGGPERETCWLMIRI